MPDLSTSIGRRDRNLLLVALQTGLRVSELIGVNVGDVVLGPPCQPHIRCRGKGRKERATPLRGDSAKALAQWLPERAGAPQEPLFASNRKRRFSRDGIERIVRKYTRLASATCPSLACKRVSPHTLRHTAAMELLQSGVGCTVIALWLGHESVETTHDLSACRHADQKNRRWIGQGRWMCPRGSTGPTTSCWRSSTPFDPLLCRQSDRCDPVRQRLGSQCRHKTVVGI